MSIIENVGRGVEIMQHVPPLCTLALLWTFLEYSLFSDTMATESKNDSANSVTDTRHLFLCLEEFLFDYCDDVIPNSGCLVSVQDGGFGIRCIAHGALNESGILSMSCTQLVLILELALQLSDEHTSEENLATSTGGVENIPRALFDLVNRLHPHDTRSTERIGNFKAMLRAHDTNLVSRSTTLHRFHNVMHWLSVLMDAHYGAKSFNTFGLHRSSSSISHCNPGARVRTLSFIENTLLTLQRGRQVLHEQLQSSTTPGQDPPNLVRFPEPEQIIQFCLQLWYNSRTTSGANFYGALCAWLDHHLWCTRCYSLLEHSCYFGLDPRPTLNMVNFLSIVGSFDR